MNELTLGDVAHVVMGQSPDGRTYNKDGEGTPLLNGPVEFGPKYPIAVQWTTEPSKFAQPGDILFCVRGNTLGRQNLADRAYAIGRGLAAIRAKAYEAETEYLGFWLQFKAKSILDAGNGSTFPSVSSDYLEGLEFPRVGVADQARIAEQLRSQLSEVEKSRQATETALSDVEALKAAVYRKTFKQIVPVAQPMNLPIAPTGWQWKKLTELAELESGHTPSRFKPDWWGGDISWVSLTEIRSLDGKWVEETQLRTNEEGIANSSARVLPKGTVCLSRTASVGFVTIMAKPMATSQDFADWICGETLDPEFLMYALLRSRDQLRAIAEGATHKTIYMPALRSFHICAPDPAEQRTLVKALRDELKRIEVVRLGLETQLSELKQLPNRILAQAFES